MVYYLRGEGADVQAEETGNRSVLPLFFLKITQLKHGLEIQRTLQRFEPYASMLRSAVSAA